jgi:hypothetical protein
MLISEKSIECGTDIDEDLRESLVEGFIAPFYAVDAVCITFYCLETISQTFFSLINVIR